MCGFPSGSLGARTKSALTPNVTINHSGNGLHLPVPESSPQSAASHKLDCIVGLHFAGAAVLVCWQSFYDPSVALIPDMIQDILNRGISNSYALNMGSHPYSPAIRFAIFMGACVSGVVAALLFVTIAFRRRDIRGGFIRATVVATCMIFLGAAIPKLNWAGHHRGAKSLLSAANEVLMMAQADWPAPKEVVSNGHIQIAGVSEVEGLYAQATRGIPRKVGLGYHVYRDEGAGILQLSLTSSFDVFLVYVPGGQLSLLQESRLGIDMSQPGIFDCEHVYENWYLIRWGPPIRGGR